MPKSTIKTSDKYGRLTVIQQIESTSGGKARWLCRCDCGNEKIMRTQSLKNPNAQSCGCLQKELRNETGNQYGKLTVICPYEDKPPYKWLCRCACGNEIAVIRSRLRSGNVKSCGCLIGQAHRLPEGESALNALYYSYKQTAKRRGFEWIIDKTQFENLSKQLCHYCGAKPSQKRYSNYKKDGTPAGNGIYIYNGLDRIDSNKGYIIENVVSCCSRCNYAKNSMSLEEFIQWLKNIYNHMVQSGLMDINNQGVFNVQSKNAMAQRTV